MSSNTTIPSALALKGCSVKKMNAAALAISTSDILGAVRATAFYSPADLEASITGNGTVGVAMPVGTNISAPMFLIKTGLGRDKQTVDINIAINGHRVGTPLTKSSPITAKVTITPVPGDEAVALVMFAEALQSGQFYPTAFQMTEGEGGHQLDLVVTGALGDTVTKIFPITPGSQYFDDVTAYLQHLARQ